VILEGVAGQLFPAILIARLVFFMFSRSGKLETFEIFFLLESVSMITSGADTIREQRGRVVPVGSVPLARPKGRHSPWTFSVGEVLESPRGPRFVRPGGSSLVLANRRPKTGSIPSWVCASA